MKNLIVSLIVLFSISCSSLGQAQGQVYSPLQLAHNGLWFDRDVEGFVVTLYPISRGVESRTEALMVINTLDFDNSLEKDWEAFFFDDFSGPARVVVEDDLIGTPGNIGEGQVAWRVVSVGETCDLVMLNKYDAFGNEVESYDLERLAPNNAPGNVCYTCPAVAAGPFPPGCGR